MKTPLGMAALVMIGALAVGGCRHTWDGAKTDTKRAVQKTGHGIEKAGEKIEGAGEKKK
jgi:predicted small secreted protein